MQPLSAAPVKTLCDTRCGLQQGHNTCLELRRVSLFPVESATLKKNYLNPTTWNAFSGEKSVSSFVYGYSLEIIKLHETSS